MWMSRSVPSSIRILARTVLTVEALLDLAGDGLATGAGPLCSAAAAAEAGSSGIAHVFNLRRGYERHLKYNTFVSQPLQNPQIIRI